MDPASESSRIRTINRRLRLAAVDEKEPSTHWSRKIPYEVPSARGGTSLPLY